MWMEWLISSYLLCIQMCAGYLRWERMKLTDTQIWFSLQPKAASCMKHWVVCEWEHSIHVWYIYQTRHRDDWGNKRDICNRSNKWESHYSLISLLYLDLRQSWLTFWVVLAPSQTRNLVLLLRTTLAPYVSNAAFFEVCPGSFWNWPIHFNINNHKPAFSITQKAWQTALEKVTKATSNRNPHLVENADH